MYQYLFAGQNVWSAERLAELQALKGIAFKVIDFISQFEDELVKIWNKPKFVRNSHYIITLDKLSPRPASGEWLGVREKLLAHPDFPAQVQEWRELGMLEDDFRPEMLTQTDLVGAPLYPRYQYLPLDTKHFPDLEPDLLACFDGLDAALDGWLVHSENYQALTTLLPKFRERVDAIYIDPPYNIGPSEINYVNNYKDSSWLSLLKDRINFGLGYLHSESVMAIAIDDYLLVRLSEHLDEGYPGFERIVVIVNHHPQGAGGNNISRTHEYMLYFVPRGKDLIRGKEKTAGIEYRSFMLSGPGGNKSRKGRPNSFYALIVDPKLNKIVRIEPPPLEEQYDTQPTIEGHARLYPLGANGREQVWCRSYESAVKCLEKGEIFLSDNGSVKIAINVSGKRTLLFSNWVDSKYNAGPHGTQLLRDLLGEDATFLYPKSQYLVADAIDSMVWQFDEPIILDFFAGSGTTAHAVMNLNRADGGRRKYILVEMGEHFNTVILPRVKKIAFCSKWKDGRPAFEKGEGGMSHFVKYYELEQYEDVLRRARYQDADLFDNPYEDPYHRYVFLRDAKMLDALEIDSAGNAVHFYPERLYPGIDLAETLSNLRGKWIKRITRESVEFEDGERLSLADPDWRILKPLVWW
jgi:adenine-specific DNA-methyltransferase